MASRSISLGGLPDIPQGGIDLDQIIKLAGLMEHMSDQQLKQGIPSTPASVQAGPGAGFSQVNPVATPEGGFGLPEQATPYGVKIDMAAANLLAAGKPVYMKGGSSGVLGTTETARRQNLMPYAISPGNTDAQNMEQQNLLLNEPNPSVVNENVTLQAKSSKPLHVVSGLESQILKDMGVAVDPGQVFTGDDFVSLQKLIGLRTQGRLSDQQAMVLSKLGYDIENLKLTAGEKKARIKTEEEKQRVYKSILEGSTTGQAPAPDQPLLTAPKPPKKGMIHINRKGKGPGWIVPDDFNSSTDVKIP